MEPVHIFYKELPADKNNIFTADIAEKNEVKNATFKKFQEYTVTGLSIHQEIGLELVTIADVNKLYNLSNSIQNPVKKTKKKPDLNLKGNAQFIFLCNPQKSGASRVCITFLQITQKILTKDIFHWLELITEIQIFLQIFSVRKTTTQLF